MDCRGRVLSNEYFDVITNFPIPVLNIGDYDFCYASVDGLYYIVYVCVYCCIWGYVCMGMCVFVFLLIFFSIFALV